MEAILNGVSTLFQELYESGVEIAVKEGKNDLMQIFAFAGIKFERLLAMANPENTNSSSSTKDLDIHSLLKFSKRAGDFALGNLSTPAFATTAATSTISTLSTTNTMHFPDGQSANRGLTNYGELESTCLINPENGFIPDFPQDLIKEHEKELSFNNANNLKFYSNRSSESSDTNSSPIHSNDSSTIQCQNSHSMSSTVSLTSRIEDDFQQKLNFYKPELSASFDIDSFSQQQLHDTLNETMFHNKNYTNSNHNNNNNNNNNTNNTNSPINKPKLTVSQHVSMNLPVVLPDEKVEQMKRDAIAVLTGKVKPAVPIEKLANPISERIFRRSLMYLLDNFVANNTNKLQKVFSGNYEKIGLDNISRTMTALRLGISYNLSTWVGRIDDDSEFPNYLSPKSVEKNFLKVVQSGQQLDETKFIDLVSQQARCLGNLPRIPVADVQSAIVLSMV